MKAYSKALWRAVTHSRARFAAVAAIAALGAGFFSGFGCAAPQMRAAVNSYLNVQHFHDTELLSTLGFSAEDVSAVRAQPGVADAEAARFEDVLCRVGDQDAAVRVHALPARLDCPQLCTGRWPVRADECVADLRPTLPGRTLHMGDTLTLREQNGRSGLAVARCRVVGFVRSPLYLSYSLGSTDIGSGALEHYLYVLPQNFRNTVYSCIFVSANGEKCGNIACKTYKNKVKPLKDVLTALGQQRAPLRRRQAIATAQVQLAAGRRTYAAQKAAADRQLAAAQTQLRAAGRQLAEKEQQFSAAQRQLAAGEQALAAVRQTYTHGQTQYAAGVHQAQAARADAAQKLAAARSALAAGEQQLAARQMEYDARQAQLSQAKTQLNAENVRLAAVRNTLAKKEQQLAAEGSALGQVRAALQQLEADGQGASTQAAVLRRKLTDAQDWRSQLFTAQTQLEQAQRQWNQAQQTYCRQAAAANPQLTAAYRQLAAAQTELTAQKRALAVGESRCCTEEQAVQTRLTAAKKQLAAAKLQLDRQSVRLTAAKDSLAAGRRSLTAGQAQLAQHSVWYSSTKTSTEARLAAACRVLDSAAARLNAVKMPVWYVLDREQNEGYASFTADAARLQSLAGLFPAFFFFVAAMVVLTTMTRMVEEERIQIGTYKALGVPNRAIARRYLLYALLVSAGGGAAGILVGQLVLPAACWNAYRILYSAPALSPRLDFGWAAAGCALAVAAALPAAWGACRAALQERPAALLREKAPRPGRRILLERVRPLWQRLSFSAKVTARNLFRYKKRLVMTVLGVAGCTALLLTGFGLRDSVSGVVTAQYGGVDRYDVSVSLNTEGLTPGARTVLCNKTLAADWMAYTARAVSMTDVRGRTLPVDVVLPQEPVRLGSFLSLHQRRGGHAVAFGSNSVVVTEKLAARFGLHPGSRVRVPNGSRADIFTVTGVMENYIYNFIYIDPALYQRTSGQLPGVNRLWVRSAGAAQRPALMRALAEQPGVVTATALADVAASFQNVVQALDKIVWVLIGCAGALSFVVLYNLTSINIAERRRELATLRILGFTRWETAGYIYRETALLTLLGCAVGLVLGVWMHGAVVATLEVDVCMFPREVTALSYLWSILLTLGFTALVDVCTLPALWLREVPAATC